MPEETRITSNSPPKDTDITAAPPSKADTHICLPPQEALRKGGRCPKCGSPDVIPNVFVREDVVSAENLKAVVEKNPDAFFYEFRGVVKTSLKAWVCGSCGYTELYAKNPAALLAAYRKREEQS